MRPYITVRITHVRQRRARRKQDVREHMEAQRDAPDEPERESKLEYAGTHENTLSATPKLKCPGVHEACMRRT